MRSKPEPKVIYVVRYATRITGHRVRSTAWNESPTPRALCGLVLDLDVFEKPKPGMCGEVECRACLAHPGITG